MKKDKEELLGVRLTHELKVRLKELAEREDRTMSQEVRRAIKKHLDEYEANQKKSRFSAKNAATPQGGDL